MVLESKHKQYDMNPVSKSHASSSLLKIIETNKGVFLHVHSTINLILKSLHDQAIQKPNSIIEIKGKEWNHHYQLNLHSHFLISADSCILFVL